MTKGISFAISLVMIIFVSVIAISIVLTIGIPEIERFQEAAKIDEARGNMLIFDSVIRSLAVEGLGITKSADIFVTEGTYRVDSDSGTIDFLLELQANAIQRGTTIRDGNIITSVSGSASAIDNTTHIILENEILEVVLSKVGSETSFASINTSSVVDSIRFKTDGAALAVYDTSVKISDNPTSGWGTGYSKAVREGSDMPNAEAVAHVRSSLSGLEYDVLYTLPASSDFLLVSLRNISASNKTSFIFEYKIGTSSSDIIRVDNAVEGSFVASNTFDNNQTKNLDNSNYTTNTSSFSVNISAPVVYYNASDGTWRNASELESIGQGEWGRSGNSTHTTVTFTLAGSDGWDFGVRDVNPGGSYWLDENGRNLDYGLVGYWKFSEFGGGTTADSSGYGTTGTVTGTFMWTSNSSCRTGFGSCLTFGGGEWVDIGSSSNLNLPSDFAVSVWARVEGLPTSWAAIVNKPISGTPVNYRIYVRDTGVVRGEIHDGTNGVDINTGVSIDDGSWHHVVLVRNTGEDLLKLYLDGRLIGQLTDTTTSSIVSGSDGRIGHGNENFKGSVDEVRLYNRSLSSDEIKRLYDSTIKIRNDFIGVNQNPYILANVTNHTGGSIFVQSLESVRIDNRPIVANYSVNDTRIFFFDWKEMGWKIWMAGADNATHGVPDWLDPRYKENFKWRQEFKKSGMPSINFTYLMTAHDPFIRTFVDTGTVGYASVVGNSTAGYWQFNEGSGTTTRDETGKGNSGTLTNGPAWVSNSSCLIGSCLSLDGGDDYVEVGDSPGLRGMKNLTISAWIFPRSAADGEIVSRKTSSTDLRYILAAKSDGSIRFDVGIDSDDRDALTSATGRLKTNEWQHVAAVFQGSGFIKIYLNGREIATASTTLAKIGTTSEVTKIGAGFPYFNGLIDDVRIRDNVLTAEDINDEYQRGVNHTISIPVDISSPKSKSAHFDSGNGHYQSTVGGDWYVHSFNQSGWYGLQSSGSWQFLGSTTLEKPLITFQSGATSEPVPWYATSWKAGNGKHQGYDLRWENVSLANYGRIRSTYSFNATLNNNFMFALGYAQSADTSGWTTSATCVNFCSTRTGFGTEYIESMANSTLTYYDLKDSSLVGWWKFNENSATVADMSGNNNTGTLENSPTFVSNSSCRTGFGACMGFNGTNSRMNATDSPSLRPNRLTVMGWFKTSSTVRGVILDKRYNPDDQSSFGLHTNIVGIGSDGGVGMVTFFTHDCGIAHYSGSESSSLNDGNWHHAAGTFDGSTVRLYIDGRLQSPSGTKENTEKICYGSTSNQPLVIGSNMNGLVDNVKMYSRALSAEEIFSDYIATADDYPNMGKTNQTNGAISIPAVSFYYDGGAAGIWKFDEGSGLNATDASGSGNVGTLVNGPIWMTNSSCRFGGCLHFDGSNDYVNGGSGSSLDLGTSDFSVEFWVRPIGDNSGSAGLDIVNKGAHGNAGFKVEYGTSEQIQFTIQDPSDFATVSGAKNINDGNWHHVIAVADRDGNGKIYVDGSLDKAANISRISGSVDVSDNLNIGARSAASQYFNGTIDEVRIYKRVLTENEVREHYNSVSIYYDDFGTAVNGRTYRYVGVEDSNTTLQPVPLNGTVLHVGFNENSTVNVTDSTGYSAGGYTANGPQWVYNSSCVPNHGGCMFFDGSNDYVVVGNQPHLNISKAISVAAWIYPTQCPGSQFWCAIVKKGGSGDGNVNIDYYLRLSNAKKIQLTSSSGGTLFASSTTIPTNEWTHIAITYSPNVGGDGGKLYINGVLTETNTLNNALTTATNLPVTIGGGNTSGTFRNNFFGYIDEVMLFDRVMTRDEVYQLYLGGINRTVSGRWHRIVNVDNMNSVYFNLTDHNGTFVTQDYDTRIVLVNGTTFNASNPAPSCYTANLLGSSYACSTDVQEYSTDKAAGLVFAGDPSLVTQICNDEGPDSYRINITTSRAGQMVFPFIGGACTLIGNKTESIVRQGIPTGPFGSYDLKGTSNLLMRLQYDRIKLEGDLRISSGEHEVCFKKIRQEGPQIVINVTSC